MKLLFRKSIDIVLEDECASAQNIYEHLEKICQENNLGDPKEFSLMGAAECTAVPEEIKEFVAEEFQAFNSTHVIVSLKYRGENFCALCRKIDLGKQIKLVPVGLVPTNAQMQYLTDPMGNTPKTHTNRSTHEDN